MEVIIDGVEYVPKTEVKPLDDETTRGVLEVLTEMRYFNQSHKMASLAYDAIRVISPELAEMEEQKAYDFVRGE